MTKWVYQFNEGWAQMKELLGGKGANLAEMTRLGLPVPEGFTITTEACTQYYKDGRRLNEEIQLQIMEAIKILEQRSGKKFGNCKNPLLLSVRSGARVSMPGMMDTVLNLGLNQEIVECLAEKSGNPWWAWDCYRRFIQMYGDVVRGMDRKCFDHFMDAYANDGQLTVKDLKEITCRLKGIYEQNIGEHFPEDPVIQLFETIHAVFRSWDNPRAEIYRQDHDIPYAWGTAVNVQRMVFGNLGENSGTGVAFTRHPSTGEKALMGEYLMNAQGEDVVAGVRTPEQIGHLKERMPEIYKEFKGICQKLEDHYKDMQDMEFTIEEGKLYMLQTRNGKRTAQAALKIACDLVREGKITSKDAVRMIDPRNLDTLLHPQFDSQALKLCEPIGRGLGASPGAACGKIVFTAADAISAKEKKESVILVRLETSPEDISGMKAAKGILTVRGGMTSHAAVVARGMGKCCVSGCGEIKMDPDEKGFTLGHRAFHEGDEISIDGITGNIYEGILPMVDAKLTDDFVQIMSWADCYRKLKIRTNADTPEDAVKAVQLGAEGIGLCRTEHMFFEQNRIMAFREMICADSKKEREDALNKILPFQQKDFEDLFEVLGENPVTIRFLDPPLHEFLPTEDVDIKILALVQNRSVETIRQHIANLQEFNPMMGHRGVRLLVTYPEIAIMQTKAIIRAALHVKKKHIDWHICPEMMIPLTCDAREFCFVKNIIKETADQQILESGIEMDYKIGSMIELPRACLTADEIADESDFFCFGTNDLTQMTYGFSRDDSVKFLNSYLNSKIMENDPFSRLDVRGVGKLMEMAVHSGKEKNRDLHIGICGEHGGDPSSIMYCHQMGLDYVSCSPYRIPVARLTAAQAAINESGK